MLTHFLNFWVLARLMQAAVTAGLCLLGLGVGFRLIRRWRDDADSEQQLSLERDAELAATVMQVALIFAVLGLGLAVALADHLVGSIRGAMCAFGVFASAKTGYWGLLVSGATAVACALWLILHRFDLILPTPILTRRKFIALFLVAPLALADFALAATFAAQLDFSVIASCCSVWIDDAVLSRKTAVLVLEPGLAATVGLFATLAATACSTLAAHQPGHRRALLAAVVSTLAPLGALVGILGVVAPHALATPHHPCPFCLFHAQGGWIGWPLFAGLFLGGVTGMGLGIIELYRPGPADSAAVNAMRKNLARWSAAGWAGTLAFGVYPVARHWLLSGGVSVFGELNL